jgi:hypothetical protein
MAARRGSGQGFGVANPPASGPWRVATRGTAPAGQEASDEGRGAHAATRLDCGLFSAPTHILIACMPKSGSTFLTDVIAGLRGLRRTQLIPDYDRREHELDEYCLQQADHLDYVAQLHVRHSHWTAQMCRDYGLAPVVLVRSLFDVVVSLRDHLRRETPVWPILFAEDHHANLDDARLEEMIVRLALPWYLNFYMGWRRAPGVLMVDYVDLAADPRGVIADILAFAGVSASEAEIDRAVASVDGNAQTRFNIGVAGRGATLRPDLVRSILSMVDFYPEAAADPYIQRLKAQGQAIIAGAAAPAAAPPVRRRASGWRLAPLGRWWRRSAQRLFVRGLVPVALATAAVLYWFWPADLWPDLRIHGQLDDVAVLLLCGVAAGRLTTYKPRGPRLRREAR